MCRCILAGSKEKYHVIIPTGPGISGKLVSRQTPQIKEPVISTTDSTNGPAKTATIPEYVQVGYKGFRVEVENKPLYVLQAHKDSNGDQYLAIPDSHLGNEYYISNYCPDGSMCQFAVTPVVDNTNVCIQIPNAINVSNVAVTCPTKQEAQQKDTWSIVKCTLNELNVLVVTYNGDLSGIRVTANNNVAVVVGASQMKTPYNSRNSRPIEQLPPVNKWGKEFVVVPSELDTSGDMIKITSRVKNTQLYMTGFSPFIIPHIGQSVERKVDRGINVYIRASNPVLVLQIIGTTFTTSRTTPASMSLVPAISYWKNIDVETCSVLGDQHDCRVYYAGNVQTHDNFIEVANKEYYGGSRDACSEDHDGMEYVLYTSGNASPVDVDWSKESQVSYHIYLIKCVFVFVYVFILPYILPVVN